VSARLGAQLAPVGSWDEFINTRLALDVEEMIPEAERSALEALPASVHLYGDRVPVDYEVEQGIGIVRLRLKEGQARRLQPTDLPPFDRPVRFTVLRGKREAVRSDSVEELRRDLSGLSRDERQRLARSGRRGRGGPGGRGRPGDRGGRGGRRR
jgi:hypothetical protein